MLEKGYRIIKRKSNSQWEVCAPDCAEFIPYRECPVEFDTQAAAQRWLPVIRKGK